MENNQYADTFKRMNFLYFDMLGNLCGNEHHIEDNLRWLSGNINFIYFIGNTDIIELVQRMKNGEIPNILNLEFGNERLDDFMATGLFDKEITAVYMAHEFGNAPVPVSEKNLNIYRVSEIEQLKIAGILLNAARDYRIFNYQDYLDMFNTEGLYFYLAEYEGLPIAACMTKDGDDFLYLTNIGTLSAYRRLGIASQLMYFAERDAAKRGKTIGVRFSYPIAIGACKRVGYKVYGETVTLSLRE
ncbi:MAG: GNAT family N-acetyltransferase [Defluviitaleaceae bacterium]|nr:GNAT family N-acetyltransferase [Defluviitaleaceae bacterium]MCL2274154.1 GNAT family N-acetyltransferase [Defluviitaleaceae bacterium]